MNLLRVSVTAGVQGGRPYTVVALSGEADMTTSERLRGALERGVTAGARLLVVDLSGLRFMDSSGLRALLLAAGAMAGRGGRLALVSPQRGVARVLSVTGAGERLPVYGSVAEAAAGEAAAGEAAAGEAAAGEVAPG